MDSWDTELQAPESAGPRVMTLHVRQAHHIDANPHAVWEILTRRIDDWWSHPLRVQDRDSTMRLELEPHGSLIERWQDNGFATWGQLTQLDPGITLELTGPCGMGAVHGVYTFHLQEQEGGVLLTLNHEAFGTMREDSQRTFQEAWHAMLTCLKDLAEGKLAYGADARTV